MWDSIYEAQIWHTYKAYKKALSCKKLRWYFRIFTKFGIHMEISIHAKF